jgi:hypothetical protein
MTPVCLFVYNRPDHTRLTMRALSMARGSESIELFVFLDGPKDETNQIEINLIHEVYSVIDDLKSKFKKIAISRSHKNLGLGRSIIAGVNKVFETHDHVIILEDDLVVEKDFLLYMTDALKYYEVKKEVWHIVGFQKDSWMQCFMPKYFFTHYMNCSGWGTWKDRWSKLITDLEVIDNFVEGNRDYFNYQKLEMSGQLDLNRNQFKTWAIFWYSTILINKGLCLNPRYSLVANIGDDGSGTNTGRTKANNVTIKGRYTAFDFSRIRLREGFFSTNFIIQSYSKKSRLRLNYLKNIIFQIFIFLNRFFYVRHNR